LRSGNLFSKRDATVLDAPSRSRVSARGGKGGAAVAEMPPRRDYGYGNDFADDFGDGFEQEGEFARRPGVRLSFSGRLMPKTLWGRIAAGGGLVLLAGVGIAALVMVRSYLLRDEHFLVEGPSSIQIAGNSHLTRPQLLSVFGEDVERNIFKVPLDDRRAELERLPWVGHATVMRLLPNRVRVAIVERTPVAFVRQGKEIGLVDANGVLLDLAGPVDAAAPARKAADYSFPVLTGISVADPLSTRAARMRIYMDFVAALDASGERISHRLSEVDLSNPEDVKAILPDGATNSGAVGADVLVHFGDGKFLERYHLYQQHLAEWRTQYPKLASVDLRYERQVVLEMPPGAAAAASGAAAASARELTPVVAAKAAEKSVPVAANHAVAAKVKPAVLKAPAAAKAPVVTSVKVKPAGVVSVAKPATHLTTAFAVGPDGQALSKQSVVKPAGKASAAIPVAQGAPR
jgi:cell division protein FtsQ